MKFSRINANTINCIITQDDLKENEIDLDDLLQRKPKAMDYLRRVILEAAHAENFTITGEFTSMQIRIMKDQSISLTLSQGKRPEPGKPEETQNTNGDFLKNAAKNLTAAGNAANRYYAFTFPTMADAIECCRDIPDAAKLPSSLYEDEEDGVYYLFFRSPGDDEVKFEKTILAMNEFGTFVEAAPEAVAYIMEHKKCILKENAAGHLAKL